MNSRNREKPTEYFVRSKFGKVLLEPKKTNVPMNPSTVPRSGFFPEIGKRQAAHALKNP